MNFRPLLAPLLALALLGMAKAPTCSIRFFITANPRDTNTFAATVQVGNPPRTIYINRIPAITELDVAAAYPFQAADGTLGCALKLNFRGTLRLDTLSLEDRGKPLVCVVNGRVITAMLIDRRISDGIIFVSSGLTPAEVGIIRKQFPIMGEKKGAGKRSASEQPLDKLPRQEAPGVDSSKFSRGD